MSLAHSNVDLEIFKKQDFEINAADISSPIITQESAFVEHHAIFYNILQKCITVNQSRKV